MEEKERYYYKEYAGDYDILDRNDKNAYYGAISRDEEDAQNLINLLNQQDKRIKELEEELDDAKRDYIPKLEFGLQRANKMGRDAEKEIQQLKQQLAEKDKEIEYQESMKILAVENQNKKAIERLEKVKEFVNEIYGEYSASVTTNFIDNQIEGLKNEMK